MLDRKKENKQIHSVELYEISFVMLNLLRFRFCLCRRFRILFVGFVTELVISFFFLFVFKIQQ